MELTKTNDVLSVSKGYKQTEVGLIPEDWKVSPLSELGEFKNGINKSKEDFGFGYPFVNLMDVFGIPFIIDNSSLELINANQHELNLYNLIEGDVLFVRSSVKPSGVGLTSVVKSNLNDTVFSGFLIRYRFCTEFNLDYKVYCFNQKDFRDRLIAQASVSANTNINQDALKKLQLAYPPTLTEQKAIATALSDVDALISSLDKLITKKKAIKQGAMQELLTPPHKGGRRLPGFNGDWEEITLGEIGQCIIGLTYSPTNVNDSGTLVLRSSNIQNGRFSSHDNVYVDCEIPEKLKVQENDILVCVRNGSRNLIGKSLMLSRELVGQTWGAFMSVYRSPINDYIAHLFNSNEIQRQIEENLGATINQITNRTLNSFKVIIPKELQEQKAITQILSDMDLEIESLENKKAKFQEIKQGMMQELLTGKTRLFWN